MKNQILSSLTLLLFIGLSACGSKKVKPQLKPQRMGEKFIIVPCSVSESKAYGPSKNFFRANAIGESLDQMTAKRKAMTSARALLASSIQTVIKSTVDDYIKDVEVTKKESLEKKYEGLTREVVQQQLNDVRVICEKQAVTSENNYKTYIALEMNKDAVAQAVQRRVSQDEELKVDYDYQKFKETFEREMEKLGNQY